MVDEFLVSVTLATDETVMETPQNALLSPQDNKIKTSYTINTQGPSQKQGDTNERASAFQISNPCIPDDQGVSKNRSDAFSKSHASETIMLAYTLHTNVAYKLQKCSLLLTTSKFLDKRELMAI